MEGSQAFGWTGASDPEPLAVTAGGPVDAHRGHQRLWKELLGSWFPSKIQRGHQRKSKNRNPQESKSGFVRCMDLGAMDSYEAVPIISTVYLREFQNPYLVVPLNGV